MAVRVNQGKICVKGEDNLVVVYQNCDGVIEMGGVGNEVRIIDKQSLGKVNPGSGKSNKLNGILLEGFSSEQPSQQDSFSKASPTLRTSKFR